MNDAVEFSSKRNQSKGIKRQSYKAPAPKSLSNCGIVRDLRDPQKSPAMKLLDFKNVAIQQPLPFKNPNTKSLIPVVNLNDKFIKPYTPMHAGNDFITLPKTNKWMMTSETLLGQGKSYIPASWVYWLANAEPKPECKKQLGKIRQPKNHLIEPINFIFVVKNAEDKLSADKRIIKALSQAGYSYLESLFHTGGYTTYFESQSNLTKQLSLTIENFIQLLAPSVASFCRIFKLKFDQVSHLLKLENSELEQLVTLKLSEFCHLYKITVPMLCQRLNLDKYFDEIPLTFANQDYTKGGDHFRLLGPYGIGDDSYVYTASVSEESAFINQNCRCGHLYISFTKAKCRLANKLSNLKTTDSSVNLYTTNLFNTLALQIETDFDAKDIFFTGDHQIDKNNPLADISFVAVLN